MSKIEINFEYLKNSCRFFIAPDAIYLYLIYNKYFKEAEEWYNRYYGNDFTIRKKWLYREEEEGFIKIIGENLPEDIEFRQPFIDLLPKEDKFDVNWAKEYLDLWPSGVKSGNRYVKASEKDITELLKKFVKKYKYPKETILEATKKYLEDKKRVNWSYITCSDYFISKNNVSLLASWCDNYKTTEYKSGNLNKML